ncbi:MAG: hypothetical protein WCC94_04910 [Candidatus Bathyarchaeia archaeon]
MRCGRKDLSSVLSRLIDRRKSYTLVGIGEEVQGIVTYRDFISKLLVKRRKTRIPAYIVGLPDDPFEAEAVRSKFLRAINLLKKSFPEMLEARCTIKTSSPKGKKGRRRYEVKALVYTPHRMFAHSESGWDLLSVFDVTSDRLKRIMARKRIRRRTQRRRW